MSGEDEGFTPPEYSEEQEPQDKSDENLGGLGNKEVQKEPLWREKVLEGVSQKDQEAIHRMRLFFEEKETPQTWYYSGASADISPTLIAPSDTVHWWVDPSYDASSHLHLVTHAGERLEGDISSPYKTLGDSVQEAVPWEQAWQDGRQTLNIDGRTTIEMVGGKTQEKGTAPEKIDVIYTNPFSTFPGPDALINLKMGGYYVAVTVDERPPNLDLRQLEYTFEEGGLRKVSLQDLGFRHIRTEEVANWSFPAVGRIRGTTTGGQLKFNVYEKEREFTPEEEDILRLDSVGFWIDTTHNGLIGIGLVNAPPEARKMGEEEYRSAVRMYFDVMNSLKGDSLDTANSVSDHIREVMARSGSSEHETALRIFNEEQEAARA